jgi:hypothetical protein
MNEPSVTVCGNADRLLVPFVHEWADFLFDQRGQIAVDKPRLLANKLTDSSA